MAMADVGFSVAALTPRGHPVRRTRKVHDHFAYHTWPRLKSTARAIHRWSPDLLVCTDDLAVRELQALHQRAAAASDDKVQRYITELIELSLGPAVTFHAMRDKSAFLAHVEIERVTLPEDDCCSGRLRRFKSAPAGLNLSDRSKSRRVQPRYLHSHR